MLSAQVGPIAWVFFERLRTKADALPANTASATTVCWRAARRPTTSCSPASCSTSLRRRPSLGTPLLIPSRPSSRARAAARPCASSKCSRQANARATPRPRCPPPSGSTPHEPEQPHSPPPCRSVSPVQDQPRQRSSEPASGKAQIGLAFLLPSDPSLATTTARLRGRSASHVTSGRILNRRVEIPIERAAALRPTSRGFLP